MKVISEIKLIHDESISVEHKLDYLLKIVKALKPFIVGEVTKYFVCNAMEFTALQKQLEDIDKLIEFDHTNHKGNKIYRLTVKGMLFNGYVRQRNYKRIDAAFKLLTTLAIIAGAIATAIYYGHELYKAISPSKPC